MLRFILGRLGYGLLTVWFIATATFAGMHAVPGDPLLDARAVAPEIRRNLEARYGLDQPLALQYLRYLGNMARGDFGVSFTQQNREVNDIIRDHFPVSALLGVLAMVFATLGGIVWGALTANYRDQLPDIVIMFLVVLCISVPSFVFAALGTDMNRPPSNTITISASSARDIAVSAPQTMPPSGANTIASTPNNPHTGQ